MHNIIAIKDKFFNEALYLAESLLKQNDYAA